MPCDPDVQLFEPLISFVPDRRMVLHYAFWSIENGNAK
jgi:hypothetical protein